MHILFYLLCSLYTEHFNLASKNVFRCDRPTDLPKQATLPSIRSDTLSCLEEETPSRCSMTSSGSVAGWANMPKKLNSSVLKSIIQSNIKLDEKKEYQAGDQSYVANRTKESRKKQLVLERLASKTFATSELSENEETVKFELIEDFHLITIPITTCLMVLISYIICGAAVFSAWEVIITKDQNQTVYVFLCCFKGLDIS